MAEIVANEWWDAIGSNGGSEGTPIFYELQYEPRQRARPEGIAFEPLRPGDEEAVSELACSVEGRDRLAEAGRADVVVARDGNRLVAYCAFRRLPISSPPTIRVEALGVHPDYAGRRIGRRLVAAVVPEDGQAVGWVRAEDRRLARMALDAGAVVRRSRRLPSLPVEVRLAGPPGDGLRVEVVPVDAGVAAEWDRLAIATGAGVFARPGWIRAWADAFADGQLRGVTARADGRLVGVLPVLSRGRTLVSPTNSETPRYRPVLADASVLPAMISELTGDWRRVALEFLPADEPPVRALLAAFPAMVRDIRQSPYLSTTGGTFDSWRDRRMSKRYRTNHRRLERRLREQGTVTFELVEPGARLEDLLEEGFSVEASGWKGRLGSDVLSRDGARRLYWDAGAWAASEGLLRLAFLRLDGRPAAFAYVLRDAGVMSVLKLAFDEEFKPFGPGLLLVQFLIEEAFRDGGVTRLDFLGEADRFKTAVADDVELQIRVDVFGRGVPAELSRNATRALWRARAELARRVPLSTRERVDVSSPVAAARSLKALAQERLRESRARR